MTGQRFTFGLLAVFVAAMPWDDALQYPNATVSIVKLLGAAVALAYLASMAGRTPLVLGPTLPALVVFNVLLVVTLLASGDVGQGLPQLLRYASFAALFVLIAQIVQNRTQVNQNLKRLPLGLYSHSDQIEQWQTSIPHSRSGIGWGGRLADLLKDLAIRYQNSDQSSDQVLRDSGGGLLP